MYARLLIILFAALLPFISTSASKGLRKYPGGKYYIWRYTLKDKQGSPYSISHPGRWLSHKSIERRRRQGLAIDSTDLPVNPKYIRLIERKLDEMSRIKKRSSIEWKVIGTSRWNNTVLVRANDSTILHRLDSLECIVRSQQVWTSPDSIPQMVKHPYHETFNAWDSVKGELYGCGKEQVEMVLGQRLHNIGYKGKGITIAVLDGLPTR